MLHYWWERNANNKCPKETVRCNLKTALTVRLVAACIAKQCSANKTTDASVALLCKRYYVLFKTWNRILSKKGDSCLWPSVWQGLQTKRQPASKYVGHAEVIFLTSEIIVSIKWNVISMEHAEIYKSFMIHFLYCLKKWKCVFVVDVPVSIKFN